MEVVISARGDGLIVDLRHDGAQLMPREIGVITESIAFDGDTNVSLLSRLSANPYKFSLSSGILSEEGTPVTINPDGETETDRKAIPTRKAQIDAYMELGDLAWPGDLPGTATLAQVITRLNQVSVLVQRTNANTNAGQGTFQILRYIGKKLGFIS